MIVREFDDVFSSGTSIPKITIVIPLYNYEKLICETLDTLLHQTQKDFGIVIVNDKSTDNSLEVAHQWCRENAGAFGRVRLISNKENGGLSIARNTGISATTSEYIFFLDADNMIYPRCLDRLAEALDASGAAFSFSLLEVFGGRHGVVGTRIFDVDILADGNYIDAMAMIRRSALEAVDGYRVMKYGWEDYDLWLRFAESGMTGMQVPELLGRYRSHAISMSNTTTASNSEAVKRQIIDLHPWVKLIATPEFLPKGAASQWSRISRYSRIISRLVRSRVHDWREFRHMIGHFLQTYRTRRLRGLALELRTLEAAVLRQNKHLDIKDVRWLPQFRQAKSQAAALLPFGFSLTKTPRYAVFFHFFQSVRLEETFAAFSDLPPGCDLYITTVDEQTKRQVMKVFARGAGGSVDVKAAPFIQNGCEAAITVFRDVTRNYEYCLMIHSDRGEEGGWYRTQRQILTARANAGTILAAMEADSSLGMVAVASHDHKTELPADDDLRWVIARAGLRVDPTTQTDAPAGSMAWVRSAALVPFLQAEMTAADFSEKRGLGTTITKLSYLACENFGFNWLEVVDSLDVNQNTEAPRLTITDVSDLSKAIHCKAE